MKRNNIILLLALLLAEAHWSYGQGTVNFSNRFGNFVDAPVSYTCGGFVQPVTYMPTREGSLALTLFADIYWVPSGASSNHFEPLGLRIPFYTNGYFFGGTQTIPGYQGQSVLIRVAVVETQYFNTLIGLSLPVEVRLGGGMIAPANLIGLQPFLAGPLTCVPEANGTVLMGIGAVLFGISLRRKSYRK